MLVGLVERVGLVGLVGLWSIPAWAGKLDDARGEVSGSSSSSSGSSGSSGSGGSSSSSSAGDAFGEAIGEAFADAIVDANAEAGQPRLPSYPYEDDTPGYVVRANEPGPWVPRRRWAGRIDAQGAYLGDRVWRGSLGVEATFTRLSLRNDIGFYLEAPAQDALYLGSTNLYLIPIMRPHGMWRIGGGINYMIDGRLPGEGGREYALGANGSTTIDVFPVDHLVFSARADLGTLYAARTAVVGATVGFTLRRFELYAGFEARVVGRVPFRGPVAGLRLWF